MKAWKHEKACAKSEALIEDTVQKSQKPGWGNCAQLVIATLCKSKPDDAPLALHFLALSATELLSERHDNARQCLVMALAVADERLMVLQQRLFQATFSQEGRGQLGPGAGAPGGKVILAGRSPPQLSARAGVEPEPDRLPANRCPRPVQTARTLRARSRSASGSNRSMFCM
jgi:hypothetical protein